MSKLFEKDRILVYTTIFEECDIYEKLKKKFEKFIEKNYKFKLDSEDSHINDLKPKLIKEITYYCKQINTKEDSHTLKNINLDLYINIHNKPDKYVSTMDINKKSIISGLYFINIDEKSDFIDFRNPNLFKCMNSKYYNPLIKRLDIKNGMLLLYQSNIKHTFKKNSLKNGEQIIYISFDITYLKI